MFALEWLIFGWNTLGLRKLLKLENLDLIPDILHWVPKDGEDDSMPFELDAAMIYQHG